MARFMIVWGNPRLPSRLQQPLLLYSQNAIHVVVQRRRGRDPFLTLFGEGERGATTVFIGFEISSSISDFHFHFQSLTFDTIRKWENEERHAGETALMLLGEKKRMQCTGSPFSVFYAIFVLIYATKIWKLYNTVVRCCFLRFLKAF